MKNLLILFFILTFSACAVNRQFASSEKSQNLGFKSDGSYVLSDPPKDRARIYFYRNNSKIGAYLGYTIRIEYEPKLDSNNTPKYENYQDSLGYLATSKTFFADIYAGRQVAIMAKTESMSYIVFTPMAGKIYCIKGDMKNGFTMPRPNIAFVPKRVCEDAWIDYFSADNLDFQNQWRKVYNERGDKILVEPPFKDSAESIESKMQDSIKEDSKTKG